MPTNDEFDKPASGGGATPAKTDGRIALNEIDSPVLQQGIAYWRSLCAGRNFPARGDVTPRGLSSLLRNTTLLRVVDGGADYDYRIVGDAYVMAHGMSFQGKLWSETDKLSPGYHAMIKSIYDRVVRKKEPVALRGWIERSRQQCEPIYSEYVFLPLGTDGATVDHILVFAVYAPREKLD
jgi:hypothetical protein